MRPWIPSFIIALTSNALLAVSVSAQTPRAPSMFVDQGGGGSQTRVSCLMRPSTLKPDGAVSGWVRTGPYANRAFHAEHTSARALLAFAFGGQAERVRWNSPAIDSLFDFEVVVPKDSASRLETLVQHALAAGLGVSAKWEVKETEVFLLEHDSTMRNTFVGSDSAYRPNDQYSTANSSQTRIDHGHVTLDGARMNAEAMRTVLQQTLGVVVLDETRSKGRAPVHIGWNQNDWNSLQLALETLGLKLSKGRRSIYVLNVLSVAGDAKGH